MLSSVRYFGLLYLAVTFVFFGTILLEFQLAHYIIKPAFMILLIAFMRNQPNGSSGTFAKLIQFGLFFSWIGDVALMFPDDSGVLFLVGLSSFLIAHLGYSFGFYKNIRTSEKPFKYRQAAAYAIPFVLITGPFFYYLKDGLPSELFFPVLAYTLVISTMGIFSAWRTDHVRSKTFVWMLVGAILFILSDCVLALNIFDIQPEKHSATAKALAIANMILYLGGQFMIAVGAVYHQEDLSSEQVDSALSA